jgi:DNA-binding transcriptional LysR family regulator
MSIAPFKRWTYYRFAGIGKEDKNLENGLPYMENLSFDWNDLKFFLATARHGGLTGAATALGTSASTVSRHVVALEERLGATLFLRQQTGYLLTDDGSKLLEHVARVEDAMLVAERDGQMSVQQELTGQVRLATTEMMAFHLIVPSLRAFRDRYPKLQVEIGIGLARANLSRREADLALRVVNPNLDAGASDYIAHHAGRLDFGMYCAPGLLPPGADKQAWQLLDYVTYDEAWSDLPTAKWLARAFSGRRPAFTSNSLEAQFVAVRSGLGIGVFPCFVADAEAALERIDPARPAFSSDLWLVYHRDLKASQRVIAMRDFLLELLRARIDPTQVRRS